MQNVDEIKTAPIEEIVKTWNIELYWDDRDNQQKIIVHRGKQLPEGGMDAIRLRKPEAMEYLLELKAREEEDRAHRHKLTIVGWEATTVSVDDRKDLESEIDRIYEQAKNWTGCSREDIADQIRRALGAEDEKKQRKAVEEAAYAKQQEEDEKLRATFEVIRTHDVQQARGGEDGTDGFADLTIRRVSDGEKIRVIERDVYDFGHYGFPYTRGGTDAALDRSEWSELEKESVAWIEKFGPLKNKNMRM